MFLNSIFKKFGCTEEILIIVAMLSGESIFFVPRGDKKKQAELAHRRFHSIEGTYLRPNTVCASCTASY